MSTITPISWSIRNDNLTINENFENLNTDKLEESNLKTINGESIVWSGDIVISWGSWDMTKAVYDTNDDGIVNEADAITNQWDLATKDTVGTTEIDNNAVTLWKIQTISTATILWRTTSWTWIVEQLTATQTRSILNVEDWAEVNNISDVNATDLTDWWDTTLHTHDWRYYTETETDTLLWGKANTSHIHTLSQVTDVTMSVANLNSLDDWVDSNLHFHNTDRNRANHTWTQTASTINDFASASRAETEAELVAWANITITPSWSGATRQLTIDASGWGISDWDKWDITVSWSGATWTIDNDVVTFAKTQNINTNRILGRTTAGTGDIEELTSLPITLWWTGRTTSIAEYDNGNSWTTKTIDWANGINQKVTMTWNCTFTFSNPVAWEFYTLKLIQDWTWSRTATFPATVKKQSALNLTLTTTASKTDLLSCYYDWTNYLANLGKQYE